MNTPTVQVTVEEPQVLPTTFSQKKKPPGRLTVVSQVYHERNGSQTLMSDSRYYGWLETEEQPWTREFMVGPEWRQLDCGWLSSGSLLVIKNLEGKFISKNLSAEEKAQLDSRIIELGVMPTLVEDPRTMHAPTKIILQPTPFAKIRPGRSGQFEPEGLCNLYVRCRNDETAKCLVNLIPE